MALAHRLVTLVFSHYNEKARWALDYCNVAYEERAFMPGFSQVAVLLATRGRGGKGDAVSTRLSTPVLVTRDGERICDSTDIARWASATAGAGGPGPLFPEPEVLDVVAALSRELGPSTRLVAYWHAMQSRTAMATLANKNVSRRQALAFRAIAPLGGALIKRQLHVNEESKRQALARIHAQVTAIEARLSRTRYLVGDRFTAADMTFAALMAPSLLVTRKEGYGASFPDVGELGAEARDRVAEMRASRAGKFALEIFRRHRTERCRTS